ncbi:hypothetical protein ACSQ67_018087 [Phaseolus vulgaris]|jgi:hypothetical protein
MFRN